ncbi:hypothetical protein V6N13_024862 [Hibiscus sabdariffa]
MRPGSRGGCREDICNLSLNPLGSVGLLLMGNRRRTSITFSSGIAAPPSEGPSTEPLILIPPAFTYSSDSTFHAMGPPLEGFFTDEFGSYTSLMSGSSNVHAQFYHSPLAVYP